MTLPSQRDRFDIPEDVAYLNCAYMSPLSKAVVAAGAAAMRRKAAPWSIETDDFFTHSEALRSAYATLLGASPEDVALAPSASYGLSLAANALPVGGGESILVAEDQFPSNYYPWSEKARRSGASIRAVPRPDDLDWTSAVLNRLDESVAVVSLPHVHWTDGGVFDLKTIGEEARSAGAALVVDATQSLGAMPFEVSDVRPDFLAVAGYKWLMGPYSTGFLYVAPERCSAAEPLEHNWIQRANARNFARLVDYTDGGQTGARRLDYGERSNFALNPPALAGVEMVIEWGPDNVADTVAPMTARLAREAERLGCHVAPEARRAPHYLALRAPDAGGPETTARIRDALSARNVFVSVRGDTIRVTPHVYNDSPDLDRFVEALGAALS